MTPEGSADCFSTLASSSAGFIAYGPGPTPASLSASTRICPSEMWWRNVVLPRTDKQFTLRNFAPGPRTAFISRFRTSQPRSFRLTFRPRLYITRISPRFQVHVFRISPKISEHSDQPLAHNFEVVLAVPRHVGWRYHICKHSLGYVETHSKTLTREIQGQGLKFTLLMTKDPEILPGNILSWSWGS